MYLSFFLTKFWPKFRLVLSKKNYEFGDIEEEELMVEAEKCSIAKINNFAKTFFISLCNSKETLIEFSYKAIFKNESKY